MKYKISKWIDTNTKEFKYGIQIRLDNGNWINLLTAKTAKKSIYNTLGEATAVLNLLNYLKP